MRLDEAMASAGGAVTTQRMTEVLTADGADAVFKFLGVVSTFADVAAKDRELGTVYFAVAESTSMFCRVRRLDADTSVVLIPLGVLARTRVLTRRLLWHIEASKGVVDILRSPLEKRTLPYELAPDLVPVFGAIEDEARYWKELDRLDRRAPEHKWLDAGGVDVMADCCYNLALHELMHILYRHDLVMKAARAGDSRIPAHLDASVLRRGLELSADAMAAFYHGSLQAEHPDTSDYVTEHTAEAFYRMSFATAVLFGMYDTHRKTIYDYDGGLYTHPLLRCDSWIRSMLQGLQRVPPINPGTSSERPMASVAQEASAAGWESCIIAYNLLEIACALGEYGNSSEPGGTWRFAPITALKYGGVAALRSWAEADHALALEVTKIINTFNNAA